MPFDPLGHPIIYTLPERLTPQSAWNGHIPFAYLAIDLLRPRTFVELGTHTGVSYSAFCQAVQILKLNTRCMAVDTWAGDPQTGPLGPEVLAEFKSHHDSRFAGFSHLLQSEFDSALSSFEDKSIDLLHIDGFHSYEAVRHDFQTYLPKTSDRAVVLFHDSAARSEGFGVYRLIDELAPQFPHFEFLHASGLAILLVGAAVPAAFVEFVQAANAAPDAYRQMFARLGEFLQAAMIGRELTRYQFEQVQLANAVLSRCGLPIDPRSTKLEIAIAQPLQFAAFGCRLIRSVVDRIQVK